jgi:hypothetical protein
MLTGLNVRLDASTIVQLQGRCQTVNSIRLAVGGLLPVMSPVTTTAPVGIGIGTLSTLSCPSGYVVTGLKGRFGAFGAGPMEQVAAICTRLFAGGTTDTTTVGPTTSGSVPFNINCPVNGVAVGISGHVSIAIERVQLRCR